MGVRQTFRGALEPAGAGCYELAGGNCETLGNFVGNLKLTMDLGGSSYTIEVGHKSRLSFFFFLKARTPLPEVQFHPCLLTAV